MSGKASERNLTIRAFAVIDTNVIVANMIGNKHTMVKTFMSLVNDENIVPLFDQRILEEYQEVLERFFTEDIVKNEIEKITKKGWLVRDVQETKTILRDKKDVPFFEVKNTARELDPYLVTGNIKDFPKDNMIVTPEAAILTLEFLDGYIAGTEEQKRMFLEGFQKILDELPKEKYQKIDHFGDF